jgi:hypothetical protein
MLILTQCDVKLNKYVGLFMYCIGVPKRIVQLFFLLLGNE